MSLFLLVAAIFPSGCKVRTTQEALAGTYAVEPGGKLVMHLWQGEVEVRTAETTTAKVEVQRRLKTVGSSASSNSSELLRQPIKITQVGNELRINCERENSPQAMINLSDVSDTYVVTIPRKFSVAIETGSGGLRVGALDGDLQLSTSGSGLAVESVTGNVILKSAGGDLRIGEVGGHLDAKTAGGSLKISKALGGLEAKSSGGDIIIGQTKGNALAKTAGGDIEIESVDGPLTAATSGGNVKIRYTTAPVGTVDLSTSGGDIRLALPNDTEAKIDARTLAGSATIDFPITTEGRQKESELRGQIGQQTPRAELKLRTSGGDIKIERTAVDTATK